MTESYFQFLLKQVDTPFEGWDFSYISDTGRIATEPFPWSYTNWVLKELFHSESMLDMGTGGGEFLSKLLPLPKMTAATEGYKPNIPIARKRLNPLGIEVYEVEDDSKLPFKDEQFDLVINRHESYSPDEVNRILQHEGIFITQQVGGTDNIRLNELLGAPMDFGYAEWQLAKAVEDIEAAGFTIIEKKEAHPLTRFYDVGAICYYLKAIPWQINDFSIQKYKNQLYNIHKIIEQKGHIEVKSDRFIIKAVKNS